MGSVVLLQRLEFPSRCPWTLWFCYFILTRKFLSRSPWALPGVRGLCGSIANPEKEIPFKESVGSVVLLQILTRKLPSRCPWALWLCCNSLRRKFPSRCPRALWFCYNTLRKKFPSRSPWTLGIYYNSLQDVRWHCGSVAPA